VIKKYNLQNYIITSRPYGYRKSDFDINEIFETIGFTDENVTAYIDKFFEEQSHKTNLKNFLKQNINIKHIAYIPLMLEMICSLWREKAKSNQSFLSPMTMTELYDALFEYILKKHSVHKDDTWIKDIEGYINNYFSANTEPNNTQVLHFPEMSNGAIYDNRFLIKASLGRGGFADVYLVTDKYNNYQEMILKLFKYKGQSASIKSYIKQEAKFLKKIVSIDGTAKILDVNWIGNREGLLILQEYIKGISLADYLHKENFLKEDDALTITISLCETLEKLHNIGIIHADIKPLNILLVENTMKPILIDFGNAKYIGEERKKENISISLPYTPPEIFDTSVLIDEKIDIYSLGITLLEMLIGLNLNENKSYYDFKTMIIPPNNEFYKKQLLDEKEKEKKILEIQNNKLEVILKKTLASPKDRYDSISELLYDLKFGHASQSS
jgi:predicted Ser/Thr protein kinase